MSEIQTDFGEGTQRVLLSMMISDPETFVRSQSIIKPEYFDDHLRPVMRYLHSFANDYRTMPIPAQVKAQTNVDLDLIPDPGPYQDWYMETVEQFCRYRAVEMIILDGPDMLAKNQYGDLEARIKDAMTISLMSDLGTDYFDDPRSRLERVKDRSNFISTGWSILDRKLYGGFTRGSLNIFAGGSGSGKSLFLQNLALNWVFAGMNVVYITLELSEDLVNMRLDSMVTGIDTKSILKDINKVALKVGMSKTRDKAGNLFVKKMPEAGTTSNAIRAYLKEFQIKTGLRPDALVVDYLDLMHPNNAKIDVSNAFTKDKYVSEELRSIGSEWDIPVASASQLNRQSVDAGGEFDHSHIAGGISKINTADNVFGIFTSNQMRESGRYQLMFLKTRSSNAVGSKCELAYDPVCMRIMDAVDDEGYDGDGGGGTPNPPNGNSPGDPSSNPAPSPMQKKIDETKDIMGALINKINGV